MLSRRSIQPRWWAWLGVGVGCGTLVALSVPPFGWWLLGWLGYAGVAIAIPGAGLRSRLALGLGLGLGQYTIGLWWMHEFSIPGLIGVIVIGTAFTAFAVGAIPATRRRYTAIGVPAALVLAEGVRGRFPLGGIPLGGSALGQANGPLAPTLRIGGSLLLTGTTVLAGVVLAESILVANEWLIMWRSGRASEGRGATGRSVALGVLVLAAVGLPVAGRMAPTGAGGHLPPLRVALVQGGGTRGTRAIYTDPEIVFDRHLVASASLSPPLDLVVWPEGVLQSHLPFTASADAREVAQLAVRLRSTVLVGVEQDVGTHRYLNELVAWGPDGLIGARPYLKNHLVPFGEYVPYRSIVEKFFNLQDVPYDAIPGRSPGIIDTAAGPVGVMISYEVFFDTRARGAVQAGGQILVVPTNTASYRSTQVPAQELAAERLRAWETGRWLLAVTPTGYSAVISPAGRVTQRTDLDRQEVLEATVPRETGRTLYVDLGDSPIAFAALAFLVGIWCLSRWDCKSVGRHRRPTAPSDPIG